MIRRALVFAAFAFALLGAASGEEPDVESDAAGWGAALARAYQGGEVGFDYIPTTDGLGGFAVSTSASVGAPSPVPGHFLLFTPSFEWREVDAPPLTRLANENATLYKAGLTTGYMIPYSETLNFRFAVTVDWRGDGKASAPEATQVGGVGICSWTSSERWKWLVGVCYSDSNDWKLAPIAGAIWTIRDDLTATLCFPSPRVSKRVWRDETSPDDELWTYLGLGFGGYSGVFEPWSRGGALVGDAGRIREREFRVGVGAERKTGAKRGYVVETGASFLRKYEVEGLDGAYWYENRRPDPTLYLKSSLKF